MGALSTFAPWERPDGSRLYFFTKQRVKCQVKEKQEKFYIPEMSIVQQANRRHTVNLSFQKAQAGGDLSHLAPPGVWDPGQ